MAIAVERLNSKMEGEFRFRGRAWSVPFTLPGDLVQFQLLRRGRATHLRVVKIERVDHSSFGLVDPFCASFGSCGGCRGQHFAYDRQLELKSAAVIEQFKTLGTMPDLIAAASDRSYRNRMDFAVDSGIVGMRLPGEFETFVSIERCEIQRNPANDLLRIFRAAIEKRPELSFKRSEEIGIIKYGTIRSAAHGDAILVLTIQEGTSSNAAYRSFLDDISPQIQGSIVQVETPQKSDVSCPPGGIAIKGTGEYTEKLGGLEFQVPYDSFFQPNPGTFDLLLDWCADIIGPALAAVNSDSKLRLIDLYSGGGTLSAIFTNRFPNKFSEVHGFDFTESAIEGAKRNFNHFKGNVNFKVLDLTDKLKTEKSLEDLSSDGAHAFAICDPPRAGLSESVRKSLCNRPVANLLYISCNPATHLRDLAELNAAYRIESACVVDCFPQTPHLESVAFLTRRDSV